MAEQVLMYPFGFLLPLLFIASTCYCNGYKWTITSDATFQPCILTYSLAGAFIK